MTRRANAGAVRPNPTWTPGGVGDRRSVSAGNSWKISVATRSGVPSRSRSATPGGWMMVTGLRCGSMGPGGFGSSSRDFAGPSSSGVCSQSTEPSRPDTARNVVMFGETRIRSALLSPSRSDAGWTSVSCRPYSRIARRRAAPSFLIVRGRSGRKASQMGLPVTPSRRTIVWSVSSIRSALPGVTSTAKVNAANGMASSLGLSCPPIGGVGSAPRRRPSSSET